MWCAALGLGLPQTLQGQALTSSMCALSAGVKAFEFFERIRSPP